MKVKSSNCVQINTFSGDVIEYDTSAGLAQSVER